MSACPSAFPPMRRCRQALPAHECVAILQAATSGVLALVGADGWPYAVPLNHAYENDSLYFHCAVTGRKIDAIRHCQRACFTVIGQDILVPEKYTSRYTSVMCFGRVDILEKEDERWHALHLLGERCNPGAAAAFAAEMQRNARRVLALRMGVEYMSGKKGLELARERRGAPNLDACDEQSAPLPYTP